MARRVYPLTNYTFTPSKVLQCEITGRTHLLQTRARYEQLEHMGEVSLSDSVCHWSSSSTGDSDNLGHLVPNTMLLEASIRIGPLQGTRQGSLDVLLMRMKSYKNNRSPWARILSKNAGQRDDIANLPHQIHVNWRRTAWIRALKDVRKI